MYEQTINVAHINVGGWTINNNELRLICLKNIDSDIICVNETHLQGEASVEIDGYTYYNFNRRSIHVIAPKGSGGVGMFVRNKLFSIFDISILDKTYDGILRIALISKNTDYSIAVFATYLPR